MSWGLVRVFVLAFGSCVIFVGIARAALDARGAGGRGRVAWQITDHAALGLESFVGATILNLILNPTWTAVVSTALTIVVRKLVTTSLGLVRGWYAGHLSGPAETKSHDPYSGASSARVRR